MVSCCYREQLGYALYATFREPKLYRMAVTGDWSGLIARCRSHPKEAAFVHKYPPADTALHRILQASWSSITNTDTATCHTENESCSRDDASIPLDQETMQQFVALKLVAVQALLEANPHAASLADILGRTPLHLACMDIVPNNEKATAIVSEILRAHVPAATLADSHEQRTPLHYLVARNDHVNIGLVQALLDSDSSDRGPTDVSACLRRDICGDTPLDIVERRRDEIDNAQEVLAVFRQSVVAKSERRVEAEPSVIGVESSL
jgi:Ankyrin repeat